jgi:hypothetical protein
LNGLVRSQQSQVVETNIGTVLFEDATDDEINLATAVQVPIVGGALCAQAIGVVGALDQIGQCRVVTGPELGTVGIAS